MHSRSTWILRRVTGLLGVDEMPLWTAPARGGQHLLRGQANRPRTNWGRCRGCSNPANCRSCQIQVVQEEARGRIRCHDVRRSRSRRGGYRRRNSGGSGRTRACGLQLNDCGPTQGNAPRARLDNWREQGKVGLQTRGGRHPAGEVQGKARPRRTGS